jgi:hypothetical protein
LLLGRSLLLRMVGARAVMVRTMVALTLRTLVAMATLMIHDQP